MTKRHIKGLSKKPRPKWEPPGKAPAGTFRSTEKTNVVGDTGRRSFRPGPNMELSDVQIVVTAAGGGSGSLTIEATEADRILRESGDGGLRGQADGNGGFRIPEALVGRIRTILTGRNNRALVGNIPEGGFPSGGRLRAGDTVRLGESPIEATVVQRRPNQRDLSLFERAREMGVAPATAARLDASERSDSLSAAVFGISFGLWEPPLGYDYNTPIGARAAPRARNERLYRPTEIVVADQLGIVVGHQFNAGFDGCGNRSPNIGPHGVYFDRGHLTEGTEFYFFDNGGNRILGKISYFFPLHGVAGVVLYDRFGNPVLRTRIQLETLYYIGLIYQGNVGLSLL